MAHLSIIERAFQIAKSGACASVAEVRLQLVREDYVSAESVIRGTTLVSRLNSMITTSLHNAKLGAKMDETATVS